MTVPDTKVTKEQWFAFTKDERKIKLEEVLSFLVAIEKKKLPVQRTKQAGSLGPIRKELEKFIENVILWEVKTQPEK